MHLACDCPCFYQDRSNILGSSILDANQKWSVRDLLNFSYVPRINSAFEGTWAHGDPPDGNDLDDLNDQSPGTTSTSSSDLDS